MPLAASPAKQGEREGARGPLSASPTSSRGEPERGRAPLDALTPTVRETALPLPLHRRGKVRDVYELPEGLLMVATDRLSAFDVVLPTPIPDKGLCLTQISNFWFHKLERIAPNHLLATDVTKFPAHVRKHEQVLRGRSVLVKKVRPLPVECIARGYLAGSGWKEYKQRGTVCGIPLPKGLKEASELPEPIFTPSTKAERGHDENISFDDAARILGKQMAMEVRDLTLRLYAEARNYAKPRGILIADTKFEFGTTLDGEILLIDEVLTPDSSRFWPASSYKVGRSPPSYDKQYVRDYLETLKWNKTPPGPELPANVVENTSRKYKEAYRALTGHELRV